MGHSGPELGGHGRPEPDGPRKGREYTLGRQRGARDSDRQWAWQVKPLPDGRMVAMDFAHGPDMN